MINSKNAFNDVVANIRRELKNYIVSNNIKSLVLGISGGIDSTICAVLASPVCKELNIPLIGRSISIETNKPDEVERARRVGQSFCTDFKAIDLTKDFENIKNSISCDKDYYTVDERKNKISLGNIKARIRMIYLYNIAGRNNGMVLSTDNYTELLLGFWTLHGDVGDFGMIQNLWKTEVYDLSEYLANELVGEQKESIMSCVYADATDGLGITSTDLDQLLPDWRERHKSTRQGYGEVDLVLSGEIKEDNLTENHRLILKRVKNTEFKRNNPYNISRTNLVF
jgi:NAD+ synthetase